ncbi:hypothetical protein MLD38_012581 [Melastoma candidum]|uniref:Uncharacterized protein n=1 Tax=Melastoma candidum TaxID=119954 RepID=A0ACB9RF75_9MYRT|nr:hypothetical protein MLD38_012581 [Melastoma candidum]
MALLNHWQFSDSQRKHLDIHCQIIRFGMLIHTIINFAALQFFDKFCVLSHLLRSREPPPSLNTAGRPEPKTIERQVLPVNGIVFTFHPLLTVTTDIIMLVTCITEHS